MGCSMPRPSPFCVDEARTWFQQAHDRLNAQEAIMLLPYVCCDEAPMEARLGRAG
jgi:hypothetical protein